jgi:hypothetical protein
VFGRIEEKRRRAELKGWRIVASAACSEGERGGAARARGPRARPTFANSSLLGDRRRPLPTHRASRSCPAPPVTTYPPSPPDDTYFALVEAWYTPRGQGGGAAKGAEGGGGDG